ncbi:PucR family transcriptional regulator [Nocardioides caldifontis]|uniref:PucR family transcriptional regulator n=1 Tax=Nocardioides caldifontis TaxID=2588938 RepID=UPI0011E02239|nr:PucR family transcriptional regulator ligand-binding domain-containing protein [Nocardioides caldifontis]
MVLPVGPTEPMTVLSVLEDPVVRRGGPEVLAGGDNLLRRVRWVHVSDQPDIAAYLRGGEVLLTSGTGLPPGAEALRRYVASLAQVGVAALVVRNEGFRTLPEPMVAEAGARGLPLVRLNHRIGFAEVTRALHGRLLDAELSFLRRADLLRNELMSLLVSEAPLIELVEVIARSLDRGVIVEDASGRVVALRWPGHDEDALLELWERRSGGSAGQVVGGSSVHAEPGMCWSPLMARGAPWGRILALDYGPMPTEDAAGLLEVGAVVLNLAVTREPGSKVIAQAHDELLEQLFDADSTCESRVRRRAASLGVALADAPLVGFAIRRRRGSAAGLRSRVEQLFRSTSSPALVGVHEEQVLGLLQVDDAEHRLRHVVAELDATDPDKSWTSRRPVVAGVSTRLPVAAVSRALRQAVAAAEHASAGSGGVVVHRYGDLGLFRLLAHLGAEGRLAGYVRAQLGPLLDHDREGRSPLVETLRSYLEHNGRATETAQALYIERRTVYHRLRAVEELLGCDLGDHDARLQVGVALAGLEVLERQTT